MFSQPGSSRSLIEPKRDSGPKLERNTSFVVPLPSSSKPAKSRSVISKSTSERVRELLISLSNCDSLYLCPTHHTLPDAVAAKLQRVPVRKYEIKDYYGVTRFFAAELTIQCRYQFCSNNRPFEIFMYTPSGDLIFEANRACNAALCLCGVDCCCCVVGIQTEANFRHDVNYIGSVVTGSSCGTPLFTIQNDEYDEKFSIFGPTGSLFFPCRLCCVNNFSICVPNTEVSVGKIMYGYDGLNEELVPNPNTVGVIFPPRCTPETKALLLAAGFMLDVTYFQNRGCTLQRILRQSIQFLIIFGIIGLLIHYMLEEDGVT